MSILEQWRTEAYEREMDKQEAQLFWTKYFNLEQGIYEKLLEDYKNPVSGTVGELAKKFDVELMIMAGFLDGINESLKTPNPIETMDENTEVSLDFDPEKLYENDFKRL